MTGFSRGPLDGRWEVRSQITNARQSSTARDSSPGSTPTRRPPGRVTLTCFARWSSRTRSSPTNSATRSSPVRQSTSDECPYTWLNGSGWSSQLGSSSAVASAQIGPASGVGRRHIIAAPGRNSARGRVRARAFSRCAAVAAEANAPKQQATEAHPLNKFIEVTGLRVTEEGNKGTLKFLVVNHSAGSIGGVNLEVEVRAAGAKPEAPALISVKTPLKSIGPLESRDFAVPMTASVKGYEMPDWQFLRATYRITE